MATVDAWKKNETAKIDVVFDVEIFNNKNNNNIIDSEWKTVNEWYSCRKFQKHLKDAHVQLPCQVVRRKTFFSA